MAADCWLGPCHSLGMCLPTVSGAWRPSAGDVVMAAPVVTIIGPLVSPSPPGRQLIPPGRNTLPVVAACRPRGRGLLVDRSASGGYYLCHRYAGGVGKGLLVYSWVPPNCQ